MKNPKNNIFSGLVLVLLVLFALLGFRNTTVVALAIPLSMLISFIVLSALNITLNFVVLFSLILALGMLVDNAIVIVENTYKILEVGNSLIDAAKLGADEVAWPIITLTLTTIVAFAPLMFWPGIVGDFMSYLPIQFRHVTLTAITTILGLIPLTFGFGFDIYSLSFESGGADAGFWRPMGVAVIFGLMFGTILTLIVVPVMYSVFSEIPEVFSRLFKKTKSIQ